MVCSRFLEGLERKLEFLEVEAEAFLKVLNLGCGIPIQLHDDLREIMQLAKIADRFQMDAVSQILESELLKILNVETCGIILNYAHSNGIARVEKSSRKLALENFEAFALTDGFLELDQEALESILDDDTLRATNEENVFELIIRWMRARPSLRGEELLQKIRFPLMSSEYLVERARDAFPESSCLEALVLEAGTIKGVPVHRRTQTRLRYLDRKTLCPRMGNQVVWERFVSGGERRFGAPGNFALSLQACRGFLCCGSADGTVHVFNRSTLQHQRALAGHTGKVWALASWDNWIISGSEDHQIRVWDVMTGRCEGVLEGHSEKVWAVAIIGNRLLSGSTDHTVKVWLMGNSTPAQWQCEHTLIGHEDGVGALTTWGNLAMSGSGDRTIRVWDVISGANESILRGHEGAVRALVVHEETLISSAEDKTLRLWSLGSWVCVRVIQTYPPESRQFVGRLSLSGTKLVGGASSVPVSPSTEYEISIWDISTLTLEHMLPQPSGNMVYALLGVEDEFWAAIGREVVVWGQADPPRSILGSPPHF